MKLCLNAQDQRKWNGLRQTVAENDKILELYAAYLNRMPRFLTERMVKDLLRDCDLTREQAFRILFGAAIGLDIAENPRDRLLDRHYLQPGVRELSVSDWSNDLYLQIVKFPSARAGHWQFTTEEYLPFEAFVYGVPIREADGREIPRIGFFPEKFRFPAVMENGIEWMAVKPNEIATMKEPIAEAHGHVVAFGLGLGYFAFHAACKPDVLRVTVVERDPSVIALFEEFLLPQFPDREKIEVVQDDAFDYARNRLPKTNPDFVFTDLWHDQSDGLPLYLQMRKIERLTPRAKFAYWIEPILLSALRRMVFDQLDTNEGREITSYAELESMLTDSFLKELAPDLRLVDYS